MVTRLVRDDVNANKETFNKKQNKDELDNQKRKMEAKNIMVHICQLMSSSTIEKTIYHGEIGPTTIEQVADYQNIYVHAKISFYDNAYILLGSANWNLRSMTQDSELDNGLWKNKNKKGMTKPSDWYDTWQDKLSKNWKNYYNEKPLIMNLFPYFEDITNLNKKWNHQIDNKIQNSG